MTIEFRCSTCSRLLKTGDEKAGLATRCPHCGGPVTIPDPATAAVSPDESDRSSDAVDNPSETSRDFLNASDSVPSFATSSDVTCPMCGAANDAWAPRCLACGEILRPGQGAEFAASRSLRFGSICSEAWQRWKANLGILAAATAIAGGLLTLIYFLMIFAGLVAGALFGLAAPRPDDETLFLIVVFALIGGFYFLIFAVYAALLAGLTKLALHTARNRETSLGAMMPPVALGARSIVCTLVVIVAFVAVMLPGTLLTGYGLELVDRGDAKGWPLAFLGYGAIYLAWGLAWGLFWPVHFYLVDEAGIFGPLGRGIRLAVANPMLSLQLAVTHLALLAAGFATCYVAMLFTVPLSFVMFAVAYHRCRMAADLREDDGSDGRTLSRERPSIPAD